jgi:hypothetical protein
MRGLKSDNLDFTVYFVVYFSNDKSDMQNSYHKMVSIYSLSLIQNKPQFDDKIKTHLKLKNYIIIC